MARTMSHCCLHARETHSERPDEDSNCIADFHQRRMVSSVLSLALIIGWPADAATKEIPSVSGVDDSKSEFVQGLLAKSRANKSKNDQDRLDRFYKKEFAINKITGIEILPEACDPRDPEFGGKCLPKLPRLPEDRLGLETQSSGEFQGFGGLTPLVPPDPFAE